MKHKPERMCVVCRESRPKDELIRLVRVEGDLLIDRSGRMHGRGLYIDLRTACVDALFKGKRFEKQLKLNLAAERKNELQIELTRLAEEAERSQAAAQTGAADDAAPSAPTVIVTDQGLTIRKVGSKGKRLDHSPGGDP